MLDFSNFRVITFDCYGTLVDWETGILGAVRPILTAHNGQLSDPEILQLYGELEAKAEAGEFRAYREVLREVVRGFGSRLEFQPTGAEQNSLLESIKHWQPFPDAIDALKKLQSKFKLGIISNIDDELFVATERHLRITFDTVTTAGQARAYKPSPRIFALAESKLGIQRSQWLHAGQSLYHDVVPAKALGLATVWVNRPSLRPGVGAVKQVSARPDLEVHSLSELAQAAFNL